MSEIGGADMKDYSVYHFTRQELIRYGISGAIGSFLINVSEKDAGIRAEMDSDA